MTHALDAAREAKESTFGSFDLLVTRIGQRTNDIVKVLTLVTVILLPATVLGGIMGMNFQVGLFDQAWVFWVVIAAMLGIAVVVLSARPHPQLDLARTGCAAGRDLNSLAVASPLARAYSRAPFRPARRDTRKGFL